MQWGPEGDGDTHLDFDRGSKYNVGALVHDRGHILPLYVLRVNDGAPRVEESLIAFHTGSRPTQP